MPTIVLTTVINAPVHVCFDLSRNIGLHTNSMQHTKEKAIAGVTSGLINLGEEVTWQANHFGISMKMAVKITAMKAYDYFVDEMIKGPFKFMRHIHSFKDGNGQTIMADEFTFQSPLGIIGSIANKLFLERYMKRLLMKRNEVIKATAEAMC